MDETDNRDVLRDQQEAQEAIRSSLNGERPPLLETGVSVAEARMAVLWLGLKLREAQMAASVAYGMNLGHDVLVRLHQAHDLLDTAAERTDAAYETLCGRLDVPVRPLEWNAQFDLADGGEERPQDPLPEGPPV